MTRPDISFDIASIAGATNAPKVTDMKRAAKVIKRAKRSKVVLRFPKMEGEVQLIVYCDAAWGNLDSGKNGDYEPARWKQAILPGELACKATAKGGQDYLGGRIADCVGGRDLVGTWKWHGEDDAGDRLPLAI